MGRLPLLASCVPPLHSCLVLDSESGKAETKRRDLSSFVMPLAGGARKGTGITAFSSRGEGGQSCWLPFSAAAEFWGKTSFLHAYHSNLN